jgi:predicted MPP superfamily phosphohydrolase
MKKKRIISVLAALLILAGWVLWSNTAVELNTVTVKSDDLPAQFSGYRIAHVSDLHSAGFWPDVIEILKEAEPDIICITGDLMDSRDQSPETALAFMAEAVKIAPCYFVTGNHETALSWSLCNRLIKGLKALGVHVLEDETILLERQGAFVSLTGHFWGDTDHVGELNPHDRYKILLSHQPEDFDNYAAGGYDLVLSGHAHGGQFRLPFIGGLYAPGQGILPEYDAGLFRVDGTQMMVSRGIGNSSFPVRFNNRPEVILLILEQGKV